MRSDKEAEYFPYSSKLLCYILFDGEKVEQLLHHRKSDLDDVIKAYNKVKEGKAKLYAVWPGQYRSDLFEIQDLDKFAKAFGIL